MNSAAKRLDQFGITALMLPIFGMVVHGMGGLLCEIGLHGFGEASMVAGALVLFLSIPFAGILAIRTRQSHRQCYRKAVAGLATGCFLAGIFVVATRSVHAKAKALERKLEQVGKNPVDPP